MKKFGATISEKKAEGVDVDLNKEESTSKKSTIKKEDTDFEMTEAPKTVLEDSDEEDEEVF